MSSIAGFFDKQSMYEAYQRGCFGNKLRFWPSVDTYFSSYFGGQVCLRYKGAGGGFCEYYLERYQVADCINDWLSRGASRSLVNVTEMAPHQFSIISGEVMRSYRHYELTYSREKAPMRTALAKSCQFASGLRALGILKSSLDEISMDNLLYLFDNFPDSIIEFSAFEIAVGELNCNALIWEVRNY